jgi:hypothetical protein
MMQSIPIYIAVEDELSEWVIRRILGMRQMQYSFGKSPRRGGYGYLKKNIRAFSNLAKGYPALLLTDLDRYSCPPELINDWTTHPLHPDLLFRVAVREVESWLLGDAKGLSTSLQLRSPIAIADPENLTDPKKELLRHALRSPVRRIRDALAFSDNSGKVYQGPNYNGTLASFVMNHWDVLLASSRCHSLERFLAALQRIEERP